MDVLVKINERGQRIGEDHPAAKLTDHEVELLRRLHESGWGYKRLAAKFEIGIRTVRGIVHCYRRAQTCAGHKRVRVSGGEAG